MEQNQKEKIRVKLGKRSKTVAAVKEKDNGFDSFGLHLKTLDAETAKKYGYADHIKGLWSWNQEWKPLTIPFQLIY